MRIDRDLLGWGVFFLVAGGLPLAIQAGALPGTVLDRWWSAWPLILVGIGLGLVLRRTPLETLGGVLVAATFGVMAAGALGGGFGGVSGFPSGVCGPDEGGVPFPPQAGRFERDASISVELDCGEVIIDMSGGDGWTLDGTDDDGSGPGIDAGGDGLRIEPRGEGPRNLLGERDAWHLGLPTGTRLDLDLGLNAGRMDVELPGASVGVVDLQLNAGQVRLDLRDVEAIEGVDLQLNAGQLDLTLPDQSMTGAIQANAGSIRICAPEGVALRLHTGDSVFASNDFAQGGLVQVGDVWESPDYDVAVTRIELRTEATAGSFQLDPEEGCG